MKLTISGTTTFDPFGIPFLKHDQALNKTIDLGTINKGINVQIPGTELSVYAAAEEVGPDLDLELKVAVFGVTALDERFRVASDLAASRTIDVGGPQLGFKGTISIAA
jgi:hypothetical protein